MPVLIKYYFSKKSNIVTKILSFFSPIKNTPYQNERYFRDKKTTPPWLTHLNNSVKDSLLRSLLVSFKKRWCFMCSSKSFYLPFTSELYPLFSSDYVSTKKTKVPVNPTIAQNLIYQDLSSQTNQARNWIYTMRDSLFFLDWLNNHTKSTKRSVTARPRSCLRIKRTTIIFIEDNPFV